MMNRSTLDSIVPAQNKGRKAQVQISADCYSVEAAIKLNEFLKISLTDVNKCGEFRSGVSFYPKMVDKNGHVLKRVAKPGD